jgi:hypothetical protein
MSWLEAAVRHKIWCDGRWNHRILGLPGPFSAGDFMPHEQLLALLTRARTVLERYLFEEGGEAVRDDVAEVCMAIDDALPDEAAVPLRRVELTRSEEKSAA